MTNRNSPINVGEILALTTDFFKKRGLSSPRLDAEILTAFALGIKRLDLYLSPQRPVTTTERSTLREYVRRRSQFEPVAYIVGTREFYGTPLMITSAVLVPRPETETIVDGVLDWCAANQLESPKILDVGTGSGAIACALARSLPNTAILAVDLSADALAVAAKNVEYLGLADRIELVLSDVFNGLADSERFDVIVSNPPYIGLEESSLVDVDALRHEPQMALFSGPGGMDMTNRLVIEAPSHLKSGGLLAFEVGTPEQGDRALTLLTQTGIWSVESLDDHSGVRRGFAAELFKQPSELENLP